MCEKIKMIIDSAKGEVAEILLDEAVPKVVSELLEGTVFEAVSEAAGIMIPGVGHIMLSYKQKKLEKRLERYLEKIVEKQDEINARLGKLEDSQRDEVKSNYFGLIADYAAQAKQEEKIDFIVTGFINISSGKILQEDTILMYYDTLDQLNLLDLRVLKTYVHPAPLGDESADDIHHIMEDYSLDFSQVAMLKDKLVRLGLLESRNDADMDENIRNMAQYLEDISKGKKNARLKKLKRISKSESYRATTYGRKFFAFFTEISDAKRSDAI